MKFSITRVGLIVSTIFLFGSAFIMEDIIMTIVFGVYTVILSLQKDEQ